MKTAVYNVKFSTEGGIKFRSRNTSNWAEKHNKLDQN